MTVVANDGVSACVGAAREAGDRAASHFLMAMRVDGRPSEEAGMRARWLLVLPGIGMLGHYAAGRWARRHNPWSEPHGRHLDAELHVRCVGDAGPSVLLLHGLLGSNRWWGGALDELAVDHRLVAPDLLGFGSSPKPTESTYGIDEHVAAVVATLDAIKAEPPFTVVAHSMGTLIGVRLAQQRPELVRCLIALSPPLYRSREEARRHIVSMGLMERLLAFDTHRARSACSLMCWAPGPASWIAALIRADLPTPLARDGVLHTWNSYSRSLDAVIVDPWALPALMEVTVPVVLVVAADDPVPDSFLLREVAAVRADVQLDEWDGGTHDIPVTRPRDVVQLVRSCEAAAVQTRGEPPGG